MNENKTNINWLITFYSNSWKNPLFIRRCEDLELVCLKKTLKNNKK